MQRITKDTDYDPFEPEVFKLRRPIRKGEAEFSELTLKPPVLGDMLRTDGHAPESIGYAVALLSALSGVPEAVLHKIIPEDWADLRLILARSDTRFMGLVNLVDKKEEDNPEDPTGAGEQGNGTPPPNSAPTSAA